MLRIFMVLFVVSVSGAAGAGPAKPPPRNASSSEQAEALALFAQSHAAYRAGRFRDAVELLERAYALQPEPVLLYNLGRAYEGLGDLERSITAYRGYLDGEPDAPDRLAIVARITTLSDALEERTRLEQERRAAMARADAEAQRGREEERKRRERISTAPWIVAGVGVVGLAVGAGFGVAASGRRGDAEHAATQEQAATTLDDAKRLAYGANVAFAIGGGLAIGGAVWGILDWRRARAARMERSTPLVPALVFTGTGAAIVGRF